MTDTFRIGQPGYAGSHSTFSYTPLDLDGSLLKEADVCIVGAPFDEGTTGRPGARLGPRAVRQADDMWADRGRQHLTLGVDPFATLRIVDRGDVSPVPGSHRGSLDALREVLLEILRSEAMPVVVGGDHSVGHSMLEALGSTYGADGYGIVRLDAHSDLEDGVPGHHHGNTIARGVRTGDLHVGRSSVLGVRGSWPDAKTESDAWRARGMQMITMDDVRDRGLAACVDDVIAYTTVPRVYLSVDIDVVEPALAPGTGTPEPGGLTPCELLRCVRRLALELPVAALDVVEVCPPFDHAEVTALTAHRTIIEVLAATAARRLAAAGN